MEAMEAYEAWLLELGGGDPFDDVLRESDQHRDRHPGCALYPAGPRVMSLAATVARASRPQRVLDLGSGLGYSTLWLASACDAGASVLGIDRDPAHVELAERLAAGHRVAAGVSFTVGDVADVLEELDGPYDLIHDDAWFAERPAHFDRAVSLLRPGGVLTMPNWFLLEDADAERPRRDWSEFAGPGWRESVQSFADEIARDPRLDAVWVTQPPLMIAVKR